MPTPPQDHTPDLDGLLRPLPESEAHRLREVWELAAPPAPEPFPTAAEEEAAFIRLRRAIARAEGPRLLQRPSLGCSDGAAHEVLAYEALGPAPRPDRGPARRTHSPAARPSLRRVGVVAFALLALVAAGLYWWARPVTQTAALGERLAVTLPDGSAVELNSGSAVRYARRFGDVRRVELEGEAFFDVREAETPFVVETFNAEVRVMGTRFAVRAWPGRGEGGTTVAVASGRVAVALAEAPSQATAAAPGEAWRVAEAEGRPARVVPAALSVREATAWRRGDFVFKDAPLSVILSDAQRRFAVELTAEPETLRAKRLSLALRQPEDAEAVVRDLAHALGLRYRAAASGFEIYPPAP